MAVKWVRTGDIGLEELTPFPGNPRRGDVESIRESIRRFGQYRSLVIRDTGPQLVILAGNHTSIALAAEGHKTGRCEVITCTDEEAGRINAADNRLAELGGYDEASLIALLASFDGDFAGTGWTLEDYEALLEPDPNRGNGDPDAVPDLPADPVTKPGQMWRLGEHLLLCGDARKLEDAGRLFTDSLAGCMWTDPPYGVEYVGKTKDALTIVNDDAKNLPALLAASFGVAGKVLEPGAPVYVAHPPGALSRVFAEAFVAAGWTYRQNLTWVKDVMVLGHTDYHYRHEPILYGYTGGAQGRRGRGGDGWYGDNSQTSVFEVPKPSRSEQHPTMKPVELITRMLANSTPRHGVVYDPFGGSGSTLIACHQLGRQARLLELYPEYCDVIVERFREFAGIEPEIVELWPAAPR